MFNKRKHVSSIFYGWVIVWIGALGVFFSGPGQTYSNAVFIDEYIKEFGWSRSHISSLYSIATLLAGILMVFIGNLVDKLGQRLMTVIISIILGFSCLFNSFVVNSFMMFIGFFLIRLFGQGSMTLIPHTLVPQWFIQKRGRALSFMAVGGFLSSALFPVLNAWLIEMWNWQVAWRVWGIILLLFFTPLAFLFIRNRPEDMGFLPDGISKTKEFNHKEKNLINEENWTLKEAMKTKSFWLILLCVGIPAMVNTGLTFHLLSIFGESGIAPQYAAIVLSLMAVVGFPISFISGFILEKVRVNIMLSIVFLGEIIILLLLLFTNSVPFAFLFGVMWGIVGGLERITLNIIWPDYFGRKYIGSINGVATMIMVIGSAFGPLPFGIGYDLFQGYHEILLITIAFPIFGFIASLLAKKPRKSWNCNQIHLNVQ
ncbi:MFS transporter [Anoxybacillus sp. TBDG-1]